MNTPFPSQTPWYRQPWVWFIISLPAIAVVGGVTTAVIAYKNKPDLVDESWYSEGANINHRFAKNHRALALGAELSFSIDRTANTVNASLAGSFATKPALLTLVLTHSTLSRNDASITLALMPEGHYAGRVDALAEGDYEAHVSEPDGDWQAEGRLQVRDDHPASLLKGS